MMTCAAERLGVEGRKGRMWSVCMYVFWELRVLEGKEAYGK